MNQLTLMHDTWGHLEVKVEEDRVALVERYGPSYKVIILSLSEALQLGHFIQDHLTNLARKEVKPSNPPYSFATPPTHTG